MPGRSTRNKTRWNLRYAMQTVDRLGQTLYHIGMLQQGCSPRVNELLPEIDAYLIEVKEKLQSLYRWL